MKNYLESQKKALMKQETLVEMIIQRLTSLPFQVAKVFNFNLSEYRTYIMLYIKDFLKERKARKKVNVAIQKKRN